MPAVAQKTLATELTLGISNTQTEIPFLDNIEVDLGENKTHNVLGVNMAYETPVATGVRGNGSISADVVAYDPTDAVHQAVVTAYNNGTVVTGSVKLGGSAKTVTIKYIITKFPVSLKAAAVIAGKLEGVITEAADWPET